MADPTFLVVFEEGQQALYYGENPMREDRNGVKVQDVLLVPSKEIISKYGISDEELNIETEDGRKAIWKTYPIKRIRWLNRTKSGAIIWLYCAWDGSRLSYHDYTHELLDYIESQDKEIDSLAAENSRLQYERKNITSNLLQQVKTWKEIYEVIGESGPPPSEEDENA